VVVPKNVSEGMGAADVVVGGGAAHRRRRNERSAGPVYTGTGWRAAGTDAPTRGE